MTWASNYSIAVPGRTQRLCPGLRPAGRVRALMLPLDWGSFASFLSSGVLYVISKASHQRALQLESAKQVNSLSGIRSRFTGKVNHSGCCFRSRQCFIAELRPLHGQPQLIAVQGNAWAEEPLRATTSPQELNAVIVKVHQSLSLLMPSLAH